MSLVESWRSESKQQDDRQADTPGREQCFREMQGFVISCLGFICRPIAIGGLMIRGPFHLTADYMEDLNAGEEDPTTNVIALTASNCVATV